MCGIAGYFGIRSLPQRRISAASSVLEHRGPDGDGTYAYRHDEFNVALLHRRLAILDLDVRSDQPFRFEGCVLAFNGEIYNYLEVREELRARGHQFLTDGDTEVLAHALREWGEDALSKLEGMWAFAWYDESAGALLLCRDRFGEKPLYVWRHSDGIYFASEVKALAALAGAWPKVNENHLLRYLINGYKALYKVPETFFAGVEELPPASVLHIKDAKPTVPSRYWNPRPVEEEGMTYAAAVTRTRDALIESVRLRMRADVPMAFCMSGGVDSNSLISIAKRELGCDVHGFTIVNTDKRYEEQDAVHYAVRELGIRHTAVPLQQAGFIENLRRLVSQHDAPIYTISYFVHWQLMQAIAAQGYKVTISGTGADELFTGYYDHHNLYLHAISSDIRAHASALTYWREHQANVVRNPFLQDPDLYLKNPAFRDHIFLNNDVFTSWLHKPWQEAFTETDYGIGLLRNRMLNELFAEAVPVILHEDDLNAMYFSMENRSPFLDSRLFEVAYSIPSRYLIREGRAKAVLRDAMRGIVPEEILQSRRKVGFNAPIMDLLDVRDPEVRACVLDDSPIYRIVRKDKIEMLMNQDVLANSASKFLFYFLNMKLFLDEAR